MRHLHCLFVSASLLACAPKARPVATAPKASDPADLRTATDLPAWVTDTDRVARAAGAGDAQLLDTGAGVPGDALGGLVNVPNGRCALLYARGTANLEDLDLLVFAEDGAELGGDEAPDAHPTVLLCPPTEQRVHVSARVVQGRGLLSLVVHDVPAAHVDDVRRALAPGRSVEPNKAETWPGLDAALAEHRAAIGGSWLDLRRVAVPVDSRLPSRLSANVPGGGCIDALALPSDEIGGLDLDVLDDHGRIFARGQSQAEQRWSVICAGEQASEVSFEVRPLSGRGVVLFVLSSSRSQAPREQLAKSVFTGGSPPRALGASGARPPANTALTRLELGVGEIQSLPLEFEGCASLSFSPEDPLLGYEARIWSKGGQMLGETMALAAAFTFVCLPKGGARLDLAAARRAGPLTVALGNPRQVDREAMAAPLALSRLLTRLQMGQAAWLEPLPEVHRVELARDRLARVELTVPEGQCSTFSAALDAGARTFEVRVRDTQSNRDLWSERGTESVGTTVCSEGRKPRSLVVELRTIDSPATALWSTAVRPAPR